VKGLPLKARKTRKEDGFSFRVYCVRLLVILLLAGISVQSVRAEIEEARVMEVAKGLACLCGDCPNRPLDECRCGFAGQQREKIAKGLEAGMTKDQVIAGFVTDFGERIFVTPPAEGFNLLAWFMPVFGILIGGYAVKTVLRGWSRDAVRSAPAAESKLSQVDRDKLDSVLRERDT